MTDLELAEKALEVMGWKRSATFLAGAKLMFHKNGEVRKFWLMCDNPLSNDLAAEGKRWLKSNLRMISIHLYLTDDMYINVMYAGQDEFKGVFPTENEAVLRAVVEIGKKEN